MKSWLALATLALVPGVAMAQVDDGQWRGAYLVKVKPGEKRYFYNAWDDSCTRPAPRCRAKRFVIPGDVLIAYGTKGVFTEVEFVHGKTHATTTGHLVTDGLERATLPAASWTGSWQATEKAIAIKPSRLRGRLMASGNATWGMGDPDRVKRGGIHIGQFEALIIPVNGEASFTQGENPEAATGFYDGKDYDCRVKMRLIGPYLLAYDTGNCGGMNVSFAGAYRK